MIKGICNSCLRVREFESHEDAHRADCVCGATAENSDAFCACGVCVGTIEDLQSGKLENVYGLRAGVVLRKWTAGDGCS